jgi:polyisoprenoid-binding protein YceI
MRKHLAICFVIGATVTCAFAADNYTIDPISSLARFEIAQVGIVPLGGRFNKTSGKLTMDLSAKSGSVNFTIETASIDMGSKGWSSHLGDEGLLNVKKYPTMNFKSDKLVFSGDKVVAAEGQFNMLGVTKPVKLVVQNFQCGVSPIDKRDICSGDVSTILKRSDFGLKKYIPAVSDEVNISVRVDAYKS